jgi:hypothetical protein
VVGEGKLFLDLQNFHSTWPGRLLITGFDQLNSGMAFVGVKVDVDFALSL